MIILEKIFKKFLNFSMFFFNPFHFLKTHTINEIIKINRMNILYILDIKFYIVDIGVTCINMDVRLIEFSFKNRVRTLSKSRTTKCLICILDFL